MKELPPISVRGEMYRATVVEAGEIAPYTGLHLFCREQGVRGWLESTANAGYPVYFDKAGSPLVDFYEKAWPVPMSCILIIKEQAVAAYPEEWGEYGP